MWGGGSTITDLSLNVRSSIFPCLLKPVLSDIQRKAFIDIILISVSILIPSRSSLIQCFLNTHLTAFPRNLVRCLIHEQFHNASQWTLYTHCRMIFINPDITSRRQLLSDHVFEIRSPTCLGVLSYIVWNFFLCGHSRITSQEITFRN